MEDEGSSILPTATAATTTTNRASLKTRSHFNNLASWKHQLRENCYKRVRENRTRLLWKLRLPSNTTLHSFNHDQNQNDLIKYAFQDIVSSEVKKIKESSADDCLNFPTSALEANDVLWEYDGLHDAYEGECEEILLEMQRIFCEDLKAEPVRKGSRWLVNEKMWCPICKQGELLENEYLIYSTLCELQLNKGNEVNSDLVWARLAEVHAEHIDRVCRSKPRFLLGDKI